MAKIVTLGEIMLRLSPPNHQRLLQANNFDALYGGGEANVAISLSLFGEDSVFVTKVPDQAIGHSAVQHLQQYGVDTSFISYGGERLGLYYLEPGIAMRPSLVLYDRSHSAISEASVDDFDFEELFADVDWFHFSGITPALSDDASKVVLAACKAAKKQNVTISVDLNYRKKLWTTSKAQSVMKPLMEYVDVCIGNEEDAKNILGYELESSNVEEGYLDTSEYQSNLRKMIQDYGFDVVVTTLRESVSASHNKWRALAFNGKESIESTSYDITPIVDRVGAGDSFSAGFIYGMLHQMSLKDTVEFATAASALKHTVHGDQNIVSVEEVNALVNGDASGRVKR